MEDLSQFNRKVRIEKLLRAAFPVAAFDVFDDSKDHAGHAHGFNGETHYRLHIVDDSFRGESKLQSQRRILQAIQPEFDAGLHSFVIEKITSRNLP